MRVKKFEAKNMKEALKMVKNELGPDAVILSARDNRKSFGLGGEASVEITAAVSDSTLQKKRFTESRMTMGDREKFQAADARTQRSLINRMVENRTREAAPRPEKRPITTTSYIDIPDDVEQTPRRRAAMERASGRNIRELLNEFDQAFQAENPDLERREERREERRDPRREEKRAAPPAPAAEKMPAPSGPNSERALARIRNAAVEAFKAGALPEGLFDDSPSQPAKPAPEVQRSSVQRSSGGLEMVRAAEPQQISVLKDEIDRLNKVLETFRKVPQTFVSMHPGADYSLPFEVSFMFQKLSESGISAENCVEILQAAVKEIDPVQIKKRPVVDAWVARWLLNNVTIVPQPGQGRLHLFVGGSGSGKTSTLVKMASQLVVKEKRRVAILSTDSFKVGAVDQLKIYCQILNVPFAVIRNRTDWEWVLGQLAGVDHILVDFPGFQLRDLEEIQMFRSLLPPAEAQPITHFCSAATSKDGDVFEMARRYKVCEPQDLIFTCLDQSVQHGLIYNLHRKTGLRLHSFGLGSRIPEDYEAASKERVLDLIFKLTKLRREIK